MKPEITDLDTHCDSVMKNADIIINTQAVENLDSRRLTT